MHAGKKAPASGRTKAASTQPSKASKAAAAALVTVQASAHASSKYTMAPAYPVDVPVPAASMSASCPHPPEPPAAPECTHIYRLLQFWMQKYVVFHSMISAKDGSAVSVIQKARI